MFHNLRNFQCRSLPVHSFLLLPIHPANAYYAYSLRKSHIQLPTDIEGVTVSLRISVHTSMTEIEAGEHREFEAANPARRLLKPIPLCGRYRDIVIVRDFGLVNFSSVVIHFLCHPGHFMSVGPQIGFHCPIPL